MLCQFQIREIMKKLHSDKVLSKILLHLEAFIEEDKFQLCILGLPITSLLANLFHFTQRFLNQRKILGCFDTHIQIW
jgi:hypothetical protein